MSELEVSKEFLEQCQTMPKHQRHNGQYTKQEIQRRRNEVYRYHFEYGYSARKISELLNINRNTINGDIKHWYSKVTKANDIQPESAIFTILERLDIQRTRIREYLDQTSNISEKITVEKILLDIDYKIAQTNNRLAESGSRIENYAVEFLNEYLKSHDKNNQIFTLNQKLSVSESTLQQINKVISQDKKNLWQRQN